MRFPLDFTLKRLAERQVHDDEQTPAEWCKSTSLTKNGDEIMFPNQGDVWSVGETKGFGWTGGVNVVDGQSQTFSLEIGSEDDTNGSKPVKVFADKTFQYPSDDWQVWNDDCPDTYLSYYWTIPKDFDIGDTRFVARLINTTDPDNKTTLTSNFFYIDSHPAEVALQAFAPTESEAPDAITLSPASATSVSTLVSETSVSAPTATLNAVADADVTAVPASSGLSTSAKAGIGAGVGILGLMLILIGFFFWWYKKRQNRGIQEKGFVQPVLTINTPESPMSDAGQSLKPRMSTGGLSARPRLSEVGSIGSRLSEGRISPRPLLSEGRNSPKPRLSESGSARPRLSEGRNSPKSPLSEGRISPRPRVSDGSSARPRLSRDMEDVPGSPLYRTRTERESHRKSIRLVYEPNQDPLGLPADVSMWSPKNSQDGLNRS
ncbi:unnamed protein product [Fusarium equiseti]|uniref:Uncharacterized protein n=1 Tax=Fusarium equiseti TaxID=61235 RepID=A0A8J2IVD4_FUSEQ|nr:unnamed protein product [Fusarium equiseti]